MIKDFNCLQQRLNKNLLSYMSKLEEFVFSVMSVTLEGLHGS